MYTFREVIATTQPYPKYLPICHSCDIFEFRSILDSETLKPAYCDLFLTDLLYFFYGKPSYRVSNTSSNTRLLAAFPVCFVLKIQQISDIYQVFPFDTGAFNGKRYEQHMHPKMTIDAFVLNPTTEEPAKVVNFFYENNSDYLYCKPKPMERLNVPTLSFEIQSYHSMISTSVELNTDDRNSTIEIQTTKPVGIINGAVEYIVLPSQFFDVKDVVQTLEQKYGLYRFQNIGEYPTRLGALREYHGSIWEKVEEFIKRSGYL